MPRGGTLRLSTSRVDVLPVGARVETGDVARGPWTVLAVEDQGTGMDEATVRRAFEPFFTTKPAGKGTGLGLATVYGIVTQGGGRVTVDTAPGRGTTFRVLLPAVEEEAEAAVAPLPEAPARGSEWVLLVEDEDDVRRLTSTLLERLGYTVFAAPGLDEAMRASDVAGRIDLILSDVVLRDGSGREVAERVRERHPEARVLYMSGYPDDEIVRHGIVEARVPFLPKPFGAAGLAKKVREALDGVR
jgi:CheY-like chemotaxis protein